MNREAITRRMSIRLSADLAEALDRCADEDSRTPADWARLAIERATQAHAQTNGERTSGKGPEGEPATGRGFLL